MSSYDVMGATDLDGLRATIQNEERVQNATTCAFVIYHAFTTSCAVYVLHLYV
jgi:hypothetical protein